MFSIISGTGGEFPPWIGGASGIVWCWRRVHHQTGRDAWCQNAGIVYRWTKRSSGKH